LAAQKRDYYDVLGLDRDCKVGEIKQAYRSLARKYHPDVNNGNPEAEEKFKEISEAYAVLSNEDKRIQYDRFGFSNNLFKDFDYESVFSEFGFGDIFNMFFGNGFGSSFSSTGRRQKRGSDISIVSEINFKESAFGIKKEIEYRVNEICEKCNGRGSEREDGKAKCSVCGGTGQIREARQTFIGNIITTSTCRNCGGTGEIIKNPCKKCGGNGYYKHKKKIKVNIPAGIHNGDQLRVRDKGNSIGAGSIKGDLLITIKVKAHPVFKRDGDNVISDIDISFAQAALGCKLELDTLDGREEVIIRPGTQPGEKIVLRSRGVVELNGYRRGDYIINVNVKIPTRLDNEEINLLKRYAEGREEAVGDGTSSFFSSIKNAFKR